MRVYAVGRRLRPPVAAQVDGQRPPLGAEVVELRLPLTGRAAEAVDEDHRQAARAAVVDVQGAGRAVDPHRRRGERRAAPAVLVVVEQVVPVLERLDAPARQHRRHEAQGGEPEQGPQRPRDAATAAGRSSPLAHRPDANSPRRRPTACAPAAPAPEAGSAGLPRSWPSPLRCPLELRVLAGDHRVRVVLDLDVGVDAVALDDLACRRRGWSRTPARRPWPPSSSGAVVGDADDAAPGALADQRPQPACWNIAGKMSPSEAEFSMISADHVAVEDRLGVGGRVRRCCARSACRAACARAAR